MADGSVLITAGSGTPIRVLTGLGAGTADQQVVTLADSAGNLLGTAVAGLPVVPSSNTVSALATVAMVVSTSSILIASGSRLLATIYNDLGADLYVAYTSTAASTTAFSVKLAPGDYLEVPSAYTGAVTGISTAAGSVRTTVV